MSSCCTHLVVSPPQLVTPPINTNALAVLSSVAGETLQRFLPRIVPALLAAAEQHTSEPDHEVHIYTPPTCTHTYTPPHLTPAPPPVELASGREHCAKHEGGGLCG